jgi:hypothetical protein
MKHYRILEKRVENKLYVIQYLKKFIFGLYFWKKVDNITYNKYEDALNQVKKIIKQEDYETSEYGYHYVDAYKIFKFKENKEEPILSTAPVERRINSKNTNPVTVSKSKFVNKSVDRKNLNKSTFVPKN